MKILRSLIPLMIVGFSGCATTYQAPDFPNKWKPINELTDAPVAIALTQQQVFRVTQLDTTVKELLTRWAEEAKMPIVYDHTHDFTLFKPVLNINSPDLNIALKQLSDLYVNQGIAFYIENNVIVASKIENQRFNQLNYQGQQ